MIIAPGRFSAGIIETGQLLLSGDEQGGMDALELSGDENSGTDVLQNHEVT